MMNRFSNIRFDEHRILNKVFSLHTKGIRFTVVHLTDPSSKNYFQLTLEKKDGIYVPKEITHELGIWYDCEFCGRAADEGMPEVVCRMLTDHKHAIYDWFKEQPSVRLQLLYL